MSASLDNPEVTVGFQEGQKAFEIHVDDSGNAAGFTQFIDVELDGVAQRIFPHTVVGEEFSGHGLASTLVRQALDQTIAEGLRIVALCPYVASWLGKHPEYQDHAERPTTKHIEALQG